MSEFLLVNYYFIFVDGDVETERIHVRNMPVFVSNYAPYYSIEKLRGEMHLIGATTFSRMTPLQNGI